MPVGRGQPRAASGRSCSRKAPGRAQARNSLSDVVVDGVLLVEDEGAGEVAAVDEEIVSAVLRSDVAEALLPVEPLDRTRAGHGDDV